MFDMTRSESCSSWMLADKLFISRDCLQAHLEAQQSRRSAKTPLVLHIPIQKGKYQWALSAGSFLDSSLAPSHV